MTPGLSRFVDILRRAGLNAHVSNNISDYLTTHAVDVALVGRLIVQHDCDTCALARSRVDLKLLIDGLREVLDVLRTTGHAMVPRTSSLIRSIPRGVLVVGCRVLFASRFGEVGAGWHCSQAPDEMQQLANELDSLVKKSGLPVPAIRKILAMGKGRPRSHREAVHERTTPWEGGAAAAVAVAGMAFSLQTTLTAGGGWLGGEARLRDALHLLQFGGYTIIYARL